MIEMQPKDIDAKLPFMKIEPQVSVCCIRINLKLWIWICRAQLRLILHLLLWRFGPTRIFASLMHRLQNSLSLALFFHGLTFRRLTASFFCCAFPSHFFVFCHISIIHIFRPLDPSSSSGFSLCFETVLFYGVKSTTWRTRSSSVKVTILSLPTEMSLHSAKHNGKLVWVIIL